MTEDDENEHQCGYCSKRLLQWERTPNGRRYCPGCGAIKKEDQRGSGGTLWERSGGRA